MSPASEYIYDGTDVVDISEQSESICGSVHWSSPPKQSEAQQKKNLDDVRVVVVRFSEYEDLEGGVSK